MNPVILPGLGQLQQTPQHILFLADAPMQATGTCIWNGGRAIVHGWLNLKVGDETELTTPPSTVLQHYSHGLDLQEQLAGMMTAASMNSLRHHLIQNSGTTLLVAATAGIQNARRAGDPADEHIQPGTINIALVCNRHFTHAACIEALLIATEAKTAACHDLGIASPVSGKIATGTGTDAICLLSAPEPDTQLTVEYCGKHTRIGEWIGAASYSAVLESVRACLKTRG